MAAQSQTQTPSMDQFDVYFRRADLDQDGRISGNEAVTFFQGSNLPRQVLAQIWTIADQNRTGFLGRQEFYNALKLVTVAQSKRDLTPDIVKAALYSPASAKIPAPQINLTPMSSRQPNTTGSASVLSSGAATTIAPPNTGVRAPQGLASQQSQVMGPPRPPTPSSSFQYPQGISSQAMPPHGGNTVASYAQNSFPGPGGSTAVPQAGTNSQHNQSMKPLAQDGFAVTVSGLQPSTPPGAQVVSMSTQPASSKLSDSVGSQAEAKDSKALTVVGNGYASDSLFGDVFSVSSVQTKQDSPKVSSPVSSMPVSSAVATSSFGAQSTVKSSAVDSLQATPAQQSTFGPHQQGHLSVKSNQQLPPQASSALPTGAIISPSSQSQAAWPRMTPSDVQKYTKVFMQVDNDRDGKITGEQARNLFLSWRLPREILKQVWDLSDQDNDSMLSLREFCIALYIMERYREGRPLPTSLPSTIMLDETLMSVTSPPAAPLGNTVWRATPGFQQPQVMRGTRAVASAGGGKPPRPVPVTLSEDAMQPSRQKAKVPVLEKHLLDQLSTEEQNSLNSKFQEATDAEKKVAELEKEISDAREKIQFYHAKMQELILYKSRCDNRLNEITERVSSDKREVDSLAKKYEEKYSKAGDVASKLTIEEATFRDIQEKKMDLYRAIVKLEQDGNADGIQDRADRIQLDLEVLVKSLNERCKTYGLRAKPTSLVELPFGWQPGIQEGAADWDENWDKFEDEGFVFVKELTLDVQNVIAPPKPKSSLVQDKESSIDESGVAKSSSEADVKAENVRITGEGMSEDERVNTQGEEESLNNPPESPARSNARESESRKFDVPHSKKDISFDGSPHATQRDKGFDEPGWGASDMHYDSDAAWDFNHVNTKDADFERQNDSYLFGPDLGLNPIRTGFKHTDNMYPKQSPLFDSVPSTPLQADNMFPKQSPFFDSVPSTPMQADNMFPKPSPFFDSVPSTPVQADNMYPKQSPFFDSVPSTPAYNSVTTHTDNMFQRRSPFAFADSVPSTPMNSSNSPRGFNEVSEERSFDSFSRFDSFNMHDGGLPRFDSTHDSGLFASRDSSLMRFDSMRSTKDSEYDSGLFASHDSLARFDSFQSSADSDYNFGSLPPHDSFSRFDSIRSASADSDYNFGSFPPRDSFSRFDSIHNSRETAQTHGFSSFDDADPFGSNDPFKTSTESQTSRRETDSWKAF